MNSRLFTVWTSPAGKDCKVIGPEYDCFCTHKYKQHKTDLEKTPDSRPIPLPCKVKGCQCVSYHYVPRVCASPIRCSKCKHPSDTHSSLEPYKCKTEKCTCDGFRSSYTCDCGLSFNEHKTITETEGERHTCGHPVGQKLTH